MHWPTFLNICTAIIINGIGGGDEGDCGGVRGRLGVGGGVGGGTDDRHFYLKEPVNNNDSPFYHIQGHFMRGVFCFVENKTKHPSHFSD